MDLVCTTLWYRYREGRSSVCLQGTHSLVSKHRLACFTQDSSFKETSFLLFVFFPVKGKR